MDWKSIHIWIATPSPEKLQQGKRTRNTTVSNRGKETEVYIHTFVSPNANTNEMATAIMKYMIVLEMKASGNVSHPRILNVARNTTSIGIVKTINVRATSRAGAGGGKFAGGFAFMCVTPCPFV
jgi:hypothetical protein